MIISWFGLGSFKIVSKDTTIITDPFSKNVGLTPPRGNADIVICSNPALEWCNNFSSTSGGAFLINGPGEYDIKEIFVIGTEAENKHLGKLTIYSIELEGIRIAFLGPIKQTQLTDVQKEVLEGSDIVLLPAGNKQVLEFEEAAKLATSLEPFIVIPHSYKTPGLNLNLDKLDQFLKEMGGKAEQLDKLTVKKKDLAGEQTKLVILSPQR